MTYNLHIGETACDSDDWGPPHSKHSSLTTAIAASGIPADKWETDKYCPDEVFTRWAPGADHPVLAPQMSILHLGVAAEFLAAFAN